MSNIKELSVIQKMSELGNSYGVRQPCWWCINTVNTVQSWPSLSAEGGPVRRRRACPPKAGLQGVNNNGGQANADKGRYEQIQILGHNRENNWSVI